LSAPEIEGHNRCLYQYAQRLHERIMIMMIPEEVRTS
jgi:hypothetical protein